MSPAGATRIRRTGGWPLGRPFAFLQGGGPPLLPTQHPALSVRPRPPTCGQLVNPTPHVRQAPLPAGRPPSPSQLTLFRPLPFTSLALDRPFSPSRSPISACPARPPSCSSNRLASPPASSAARLPSARLPDTSGEHRPAFSARFARPGASFSAPLRRLTTARLAFAAFPRPVSSTWPLLRSPRPPRSSLVRRPRHLAHRLLRELVR